MIGVAPGKYYVSWSVLHVLSCVDDDVALELSSGKKHILFIRSRSHSMSQQQGTFRLCNNDMTSDSLAEGFPFPC